MTISKLAGHFFVFLLCGCGEPQATWAEIESYKGKTVGEFLQAHRLSLKRGDLQEEPPGQLLGVRFNQEKSLSGFTILVKVKPEPWLVSGNMEYKHSDVERAVISGFERRFP